MGCRRVRDVLIARITELDARIAEMHAFRAVLSEHLAACSQALATDRPDCPTREAIQGGIPATRGRA